MKLRNIYMICMDNYDVIEGITGKAVTINGRSGVKITGWSNAMDALQILRSIPSLEDVVDKLISSVPDFYLTRDEFNLGNDEWNKIHASKATLLRTMADTIDLYEKMGMDTNNRIGLDIKLPEFNDFSEFVGYIKDIEFVLTKCPFLQDKNKNEEMVFDNVDIGSTWLTFLIIGCTAGVSIILNNVAAFVDKCIIIRSHYLSVQKQKQDLEAEKMDNNNKKVILDYIDRLYKKQVEETIKELESITENQINNDDGDAYGRIELCFDKMGELIDKGLQIRASIDSPKETQVLFEPLEMKYLSVDKMGGLIERKEHD